MKKVLCLLLCLLMLCSSLSLFGCASKAPKLEEIYDRVVELVESSYELNVVLYGAGLPYYDRELPVYQALYQDYSTVSYTKDYNIVSSSAKFHSVEEIKWAAEQVYSPQLLQEAVYPNVFEGIYLPGVGSAGKLTNARYLDGNEDFYIYRETDGGEQTAVTPLIYDYATMKIIQPSNAERVYLTMNAWEEDAPDRQSSVRLTLVQVEGVWFLDKLTV